MKPLPLALRAGLPAADGGAESWGEGVGVAHENLYQRSAAVS